jgi:hypothetical protein
LVWWDCAESLDDKFDGTDNLNTLCLTADELFIVTLASLIELFFSSVEELKLGFLDVDLCLDMGDLSF